MIDAFIRSLLGAWGNAALDFYIRNNFWINALVLLYAILVFLGRRSYQRSALFLFNWFQDTHRNDTRLKNQSDLVRLLEKEKIPWDSARGSFWFPLITPPNRFFLYLKSEEKLRQIFSRETLAAILRSMKEQQNR